MCKINFRKVETPKTLPAVDTKSFAFEDPIFFGEKSVPSNFTFDGENDLNSGIKTEIPAFELNLEIPSIYTSSNIGDLTQIEEFELSEPQLVSSTLFDSSSTSSAMFNEEPSFASYDILETPTTTAVNNILPISTPVLKTVTPNIPKKNSPAAAIVLDNNTQPKKKIKSEETMQTLCNNKASPNSSNVSLKRKDCKNVNPKISEEKRERNRLAAEKYRKKGRDTIVTLERACHQLSAENAQLKEKSQMLEQQVQQLKTILLQYGVGKDLLDAVGL